MKVSLYVLVTLLISAVVSIVAMADAPPVSGQKPPPAPADNRCHANGTSFPLGYQLCLGTILQVCTDTGWAPLAGGTTCSDQSTKSHSHTNAPSDGLKRQESASASANPITSHESAKPAGQARDCPWFGGTKPEGTLCQTDCTYTPSITSCAVKACNNTVWAPFGRCTDIPAPGGGGILTCPHLLCPH
jgi:hypothetical protein